VGALSVRTFRPFPTAAVKAAVAAASRVVVLERALSVGSPFVGTLSADVAAALAPGVALTSVVAGLGGRPVGEEALSSLLADAVSGALAPVRFLELDEGLLASAATWTGSTEPSAAPIQD
jgi:pyruvate ferredoxin oxidoreductase alpha subunit